MRHQLEIQTTAGVSCPTECDSGDHFVPPGRGVAGRAVRTGCSGARSAQVTAALSGTAGKCASAWPTQSARPRLKSFDICRTHPTKKETWLNTICGGLSTVAHTISG